MNRDNKALFIFGFVFYFIGDLATTFIGVSNGIPEKGFIRVIGSPSLENMLIMKVIFFTVLYFLIMFFEKRDENYLCGAILGLVAGMGMTGDVDECSGHYGVLGVRGIRLENSKRRGRIRVK